MEAIHEHLKSCLGVTGIPLAYIVCKNEEVNDLVNNPPEGYNTQQDKMVSRAPHNGNNDMLLQTFKTNRAKVYNILSKMCKGKPAFVYVKRARKGKDGH